MPCRRRQPAFSQGTARPARRRPTPRAHSGPDGRPRAEGAHAAQALGSRPCWVTWVPAPHAGLRRGQTRPEAAAWLPWERHRAAPFRPRSLTGFLPPGRKVDLCGREGLQTPQGMFWMPTGQGSGLGTGTDPAAARPLGTRGPRVPRSAHRVHPTYTNKGTGPWPCRARCSAGVAPSGRARPTFPACHPDRPVGRARAARGGPGQLRTPGRASSTAGPGRSGGGVGWGRASLPLAGGTGRRVPGRALGAATARVYCSTFKLNTGSK